MQGFIHMLDWLMNIEDKDLLREMIIRINAICTILNESSQKYPNWAEIDKALMVIPNLELYIKPIEQDIRNIIKKYENNSEDIKIYYNFIIFIKYAFEYITIRHPELKTDFESYLKKSLASLT